MHCASGDYLIFDASLELCILCMSPMVKHSSGNSLYTLRTLCACYSQSELTILKIREDRMRVLFLYNCIR